MTGSARAAGRPATLIWILALLGALAATVLPAASAARAESVMTGTSRTAGERTDLASHCQPHRSPCWALRPSAREVDPVLGRLSARPPQCSTGSVLDHL